MEGSDTLQKLIVANAIGVIFILIKEVWTFFKDSRKENTRAIKDLTKTCNALSHDITKLQVQMEYVHKDLSLIPEMKRDIDAAHVMIREIKNKICREPPLKPDELG